MITIGNGTWRQNLGMLIELLEQGPGASFDHATTQLYRLADAADLARAALEEALPFLETDLEYAGSDASNTFLEVINQVRAAIAVAKEEVS